MGLLLKIIGFIWAFFGVLAIYLIFTDAGEKAEGAREFGFILAVLIYILPGLGLAGLGSLIGSKRSRQEKARSGRSSSENHSEE